MSENKYWSDEIAEQLKAKGAKHVISTGITPSGPIHVGHAREVVTAHAVWLSLKELGVDAELHYVMDNQDPLRKVYPFLDAAKFEPEVGKPIGHVPSPGGEEGKSYADYFVEPFFEALGRLGMSPKVIRSDEMYLEDNFVEIVLKALSAKDRIAEILTEQTGKQIEENWSPFNPIDPTTGKISGVKVTSFDPKNKTVDYVTEGGSRGTIPVKGNGKLTWRVDWPARWCALGVTAEPFGKDHSTRGGSYDTGKIICKEVFECEPPHPIEYEWISLKGLGDMSSSKGNVISLKDMLDVVPGEILRYFILRSRPTKKLMFDPALPMLSLIDEYDQQKEDDRAAQLAAIEGKSSIGVPFKHLITVLQITGDDVGAIKEKLKETGFAISDDSVLEERIQYAKKWLDEFAPEDVKFSLQKQMPEEVKELNDSQRKALGLLSDKLKVGMSSEDVHQAVYDVKDELDLKPADIFQAVYVSLLAKKRGPRVGTFLATLDMSWVKERFKSASC